MSDRCGIKNPRWVTEMSPGGLIIQVKRCQCGHALTWTFRTKGWENPIYYNPPIVSAWENEGGAL